MCPPRATRIKRMNPGRPKLPKPTRKGAEWPSVSLRFSVAGTGDNTPCEHRQDLPEATGHIWGPSLCFLLESQRVPFQAQRAFECSTTLNGSPVLSGKMSNHSLGSLGPSQGSHHPPPKAPTPSSASPCVARLAPGPLHGLRLLPALHPMFG